MNEIGYGGDRQGLSAGANAVPVRMPTLKERLEQSVRDAESRLRDAIRAREILNSHPELEELLNIMQKGRF